MPRLKEKTIDVDRVTSDKPFISHFIAVLIPFSQFFFIMHLFALQIVSLRRK